MTKVKDISYYLSLPYTTVLRRDEEGDIVARIEELQGCVSHGANETEALINLASLKELWLKDALENNEDIPEPQECEALPSGKWVQRVPKSLHLKLTKAARAEGVSLNQMVTSILSQQVTSRALLNAINTLAHRTATLAPVHVHGYYTDLETQGYFKSVSAIPTNNNPCNVLNLLRSGSIAVKSYGIEVRNIEDSKGHLFDVGGQ